MGLGPMRTLTASNRQALSLGPHPSGLSGSRGGDSQTCPSGTTILRPTIRRRVVGHVKKTRRQNKYVIWPMCGLASRLIIGSEMVARTRRPAKKSPGSGGRSELLSGLNPGCSSRLRALLVGINRCLQNEHHVTSCNIRFYARVPLIASGVTAPLALSSRRAPTQRVY